MKGLGFFSAAGLVMSPSPDPFSLAFNAGSAIIGPFIKSALGNAEHRTADQIVPVQNKFHHEVLAPVVDAKDNPNTSIEDLIYWRDLLRTEGESFYQFTRQFDSTFSGNAITSEAGAGARRTMFGEQDATGEWLTTTAAPGYATQILRDLERIIYERTGDVNQQLGIDWGKLAQIGVQVAAGITGRPVVVGGGGQVITSVPPSQRPGYVPQYGPYSGYPEWLLPAGIGVVVLLLLTRKK
jgi:hypothetical protein